MSIQSDPEPNADNPADQEILIDVDGVWRYYGDTCAVRDVRFQVRRGEVLGFLGPNGAGKTTTMQIITGVLAASRGKVRVAGHDILEQARAARRQIGYLPEQPPLYPDLSVDEYLRYAGKLRGLSSKTLSSSLSRSKERCGLAEVGRRLIRNLSKGYQQRVGIAQAIIHSPPVVILDEPTVGLDPIQIREIRDLIRELGRDHSVILSTHILPEVQSVCDRVLIVHNGELVMDRGLAELSDTGPGASIIVGLRNAPGLQVLQQLNQIKRISSLAADRYRIEHDGTPDFAEQFAQFAVDRRWGLFELVTEADSLEAVFIRLTGSDQASIVNEAAA